MNLANPMILNPEKNVRKATDNFFLLAFMKVVSFLLNPYMKISIVKLLNGKKTL